MSVVSLHIREEHTMLPAPEDVAVPLAEEAAAESVVVPEGVDEVAPVADAMLVAVLGAAVVVVAAIVAACPARAAHGLVVG